MAVISRRRGMATIVSPGPLDCFDERVGQKGLLEISHTTGFHRDFPRGFAVHSCDEYDRQVWVGYLQAAPQLPSLMSSTRQVVGRVAVQARNASADANVSTSNPLAQSKRSVAFKTDRSSSMTVTFRRFAMGAQGWSPTRNGVPEQIIRCCSANFKPARCSRPHQGLHELGGFQPPG